MFGNIEANGRGQRIWDQVNKESQSPPMVQTRLGCLCYKHLRNWGKRKTAHTCSEQLLIEL